MKKLILCTLLVTTVCIKTADIQTEHIALGATDLFTNEPLRNNIPRDATSCLVAQLLSDRVAPAVCHAEAVLGQMDGYGNDADGWRRPDTKAHITRMRLLRCDTTTGTASAIAAVSFADRPIGLMSTQLNAQDLPEWNDALYSKTRAAAAALYAERDRRLELALIRGEWLR